MEDTLRDIMTKSEFRAMLVLILVLMEDTLRVLVVRDEDSAAAKS